MGIPLSAVETVKTAPGPLFSTLLYVPTHIYINPIYCHLQPYSLVDIISYLLIILVEVKVIKAYLSCTSNGSF